MRRRQWQIDVPRLANGLAAVEGLEDRELPRALLEDARDPEEVLGPLARRDLGPPVLESVPGGGYGQSDIFGTRVGHLG